MRWMLVIAVVFATGAGLNWWRYLKTRNQGPTVPIEKAIIPADAVQIPPPVPGGPLPSAGGDGTIAAPGTGTTPAPAQ